MSLPAKSPPPAFSKTCDRGTRSYPGCSQHAPDEHLPKAMIPGAIALMAGLCHDIGQAGRAGLGLA